MIDWLFNPLAKLLKPSKTREPDDIRMLWSLDVGHATMRPFAGLEPTSRPAEYPHNLLFIKPAK